MTETKQTEIEIAYVLGVLKDTGFDTTNLERIISEEHKPDKEGQDT